MIEKILSHFQSIPQIEAIAIGGSRAGAVFDEKSDYDVYVYCTEPIPEKIRYDILNEHCTAIEIGNHFWEYEDNCTMNNGIDLDIIYRNLDTFLSDISKVVDEYTPHNGYTTCMWHNLITCRILFDRTGRLTEMQKRYSVNYPVELKMNIISHNLKLLKESMPAYRTQIAKAAARNDIVSINHRTTEFMASYFDIIFAVNGKTHPGEKRLIDLCKKQCTILPDKFEENIQSLFQSMFLPENNKSGIMNAIDNILDELEKIL